MICVPLVTILEYSNLMALCKVIKDTLRCLHHMVTGPPVVERENYAVWSNELYIGLHTISSF